MASKSKSHKNKAQSVRQPVRVKKPESIRIILAKITLLAVAVFGIICFTDRQGWFDPDAVNNHIQRKWDAYYQFTKRNEVDIVMVGNSHLYTGINPKNLSCALGANCFILAAPGTFLTDAYFCLKEAISVCKPKIAIIETFAIKDYRAHDLSDAGLSDQLQSFHARKNWWQKITSTPVFFTSDHYLPAWSNTIRNHSYIFSGREQIKKNIQAKKAKKDTKLYLERFVTSTNGMADTTLRKYDIPGAAAIVDGNNFSVGEEARLYIKKIITLCRENDIEPLFLTIPMYYRHIKDYDVWKARVDEELELFEPLWLDLQSPYDYDAFIPSCFENSVRSNQHLSYRGSLVATYKLAHFIREKLPDKLPDRSTDTKWHDLFYGEEGYYENYPLRPNDTIATSLFRDIVLNNMTIREINLFPKEEYNAVSLKIDKQNLPDLRGKKLELLVDAKFNDQQVVATIEAETSPAYDPFNHFLFLSNLRKDVTILGIRNVTVMDADVRRQ